MWLDAASVVGASLSLSTGRGMVPRALLVLHCRCWCFIVPTGGFSGFRENRPVFDRNFNLGWCLAAGETIY
jgi:hypothetical protein